MRGKTAAGVTLVGLTTVGVLLAGALTATGAPKDVDPRTGVRTDAAGVNEGRKAQAPGIVMRPVRPLADNRVGVYGRAGGCTPGYGRGKACLPPIAPSAVAMRMTAAQHPWTCREVKVLLPRGIRVNTPGVDPVGLDRNRDGLACGVGD